MNTIKVLIVDDQTIMRDGLKTILELDEGIKVVAAAGNGREAVELAKKFTPDVVLMDIRMPEMNGVEATRVIKADCKDIAIIILTTFDDDEYIIDALSYGATGYLLKDIDGEQLVKAVYDAVSGNIIMPGKVAAKIVAKLHSNEFVQEKPSSTSLEQFSDREMEIIKLMMVGKSNKEISDQLYLSEGTVKNYVSLIYSKINVSNRANAVIYFKKLGI